jgi:hypothetical protein
MPKVRYVWDEELQTWVPATKPAQTVRRREPRDIVHQKGWPILSDTLGVHPEQIEEARQESVDLGVPTDFDSRGNPILVDPDHRHEYAKALGYHDRNCYDW